MNVERVDIVIEIRESVDIKIGSNAANIQFFPVMIDNLSSFLACFGDVSNSMV